MADKMPYKESPKAAALVKAGLMEPKGGPQPVAKEEPKRREERTQAP